MVTTLVGTITETAVTMWLFGSLWSQWTIAFKVTTPMLHVLFAAAQLWGSWNFYKMWQKQRRLIAQQQSGFDDGEIGGQSDEETKKEHVRIREREITPNTAGSETTSVGSLKE
jgi:hypothetical protein